VGVALLVGLIGWSCWLALLVGLVGWPCWLVLALKWQNHIPVEVKSLF